MIWEENQGATATLPMTPERARERHLRALIDHVTRDTNDESDEHACLASTVREEVSCPFRARLDGVEVECIRLEFPRNGYGLNAVCRTRGGKLTTVDISKLELLAPLPAGHEWVEAFLAWRTMVG